MYFTVSVLNVVKHELNFLDKDTQFYRFKNTEFGLHHITDDRDSEDELHEGLSLLSQLGPDALLTMILRKWWDNKHIFQWSSSSVHHWLPLDVVSSISEFSPSQRSAEELEVIFEELLHVKAAAHLSASVSICQHTWAVVIYNLF